MNVLGTQKNNLIETVLLSTHNICFDGEIRKLHFNYPLSSGGLQNVEQANEFSQHQLLPSPSNTLYHAYKILITF